MVAVVSLIIALAFIYYGGKLNLKISKSQAGRNKTKKYVSYPFGFFDYSL
jgi:hypothetical protein